MARSKMNASTPNSANQKTGKISRGNVKKIQTTAATITLKGAGSDESDSTLEEEHEQKKGQINKPDDKTIPDGYANGFISQNNNSLPERHNDIMDKGKDSPGNDVKPATNSPGSIRFNPFDTNPAVPESFNYGRHTFSSSWEKLSFEKQQKSENLSKKDTDEALDDIWKPMHHWSSRREDSIINAELGLAEDHFSAPEGHFGMSSTEELEMAIANCKKLIFEATEHSERRRSLVNKLVQLRMRLQEAKEGPIEEDPEIKQVVGHKFKLKMGNNSKHYCEKCTGVIWGVVHSWYRCLGCGFCCHETCLNQITRTCASVKVEDNSQYLMQICPEKGLAAQNYRCAECRTAISHVKMQGSEPRQCDYTGQYYCEKCHWNDLMVIPARLLHNWDLEMHKVSRASKQFLRLMMTLPVLRIQDINPMLFSFVDELNEVRKLREELLVMKRYFLSCKGALDSKLLLQLRERQHFVDSSDMYSLQDLLDIAYDILLPELAKIHTSFAQHIKTDCQLCQAKGYICELCDSTEVLFPFDNIAIVCAQCSTVLHRHCFMRRNQWCPKCDRISKRAVNQASTSDAKS